MRKYQHIFFDLDRTIWDFEANAKEAFEEIYVHHNLSQIFPDFDTFHSAYRKYNAQLWEKFRNGAINKEDLKHVRFYLTLKEFGKDDRELAKKLGEDYVNISARKTHLFPNSHEVLSYLKQKYKLYIITNGFHDVQIKKIENSDLRKYFQKINKEGVNTVTLHHFPCSTHDQFHPREGRIKPLFTRKQSSIIV